MLKAEIQFRQIKDAKREGRVDAEGNLLVVNERGVPHNCKPTFLMKIFAALDNLMYRQ